jgi:hypothetical protein
MALTIAGSCAGSAQVRPGGRPQVPSLATSRQTAQARRSMASQ